MNKKFNVGNDAAGNWLKKNDQKYRPKKQKNSRRMKINREKSAQLKLVRQANKHI